ncbi:equilibrative nucleotide transporter 1-like [Cucurbita moschata]|uniref:Equilibrative nucleotide transporter 1-like n=1 Tax=Cucurbita moschata TaxID=3662 RepID=A0A6J1GXD9_CUCMO|nr:equilibrative nucleotide transporter 1-like [Cucurbita moschata]
MGGAVENSDVDSETALLVGAATADKIPSDPFNLTYITYFFLGVGCLLPWNIFITAVDYFSFIYPETRVDRIFAVANLLVALIGLVFVVLYSHKSVARVRINVGMIIFTVALLLVPVLDLSYIRGRVGLYNGFHVTVGSIVLCGAGDALVQGSVVGCAGELPERYMQAAVSGFGAAGVLVSVMRIVTKAIYPQDAHGLRQSANLYFAVGISIMILCIVLYNLAAMLPVVKHFESIKKQEKEEHGDRLFGSMDKSTLWDIINRVKIYATGLVLINVVTLSIFPGFITEDVHSEIFKDWYSALLITGYNVFDLIGKYLSSVYVIENPRTAFGSCIGRLVFYPLFLGCLHGPEFLRSEVPVIVLTYLLGLTNGYLTAVNLILAPKAVAFEYAEKTGVILVLFSFSGLAIGSVVAWFWVI